MACANCNNSACNGCTPSNAGTLAVTLPTPTDICPPLPLGATICPEFRACCNIFQASDGPNGIVSVGGPITLPEPICDPNTGCPVCNATTLPANSGILAAPIEFQPFPPGTYEIEFRSTMVGALPGARIMALFRPDCESADGEIVIADCQIPCTYNIGPTIGDGMIMSVPEVLQEDDVTPLPDPPPNSEIKNCCCQATVYSPNCCFSVQVLACAGCTPIGVIPSGTTSLINTQIKAWRLSARNLVDCSGSPLIDVAQMPAGYIPCDCTDGPPLAFPCDYAGLPKTLNCYGPYKIVWDRPVIGAGATICGVGEATQACCDGEHAADMPTTCECVLLTHQLVQNVPEAETIVSYSPAILGNVEAGFTYRVDVVVRDKETGCPGTTSFCFSAGGGIGDEPVCCTTVGLPSAVDPLDSSCSNVGVTAITLGFNGNITLLNFNVEYVEGTCVAALGCGSMVPPGGGTSIPGTAAVTFGTVVTFTPGGAGTFPTGKIIQYTAVVATDPEGCISAFSGCFGT